MRCLEKDPKARFPSIAELAIAIAPFGPKRCRVIVERITKLLVRAGLSASALDVDGSIAPPRNIEKTSARGADAEIPVLVATTLEGTGPAAATSEPRPSKTLSDWGRTHGPNATQGSRRGVWIGVGAAVLLGSGGALALLLGDGDERPGAAASPSVEAALDPEQRGESAPSLEPVPAAPPTASAETAELPSATVASAAASEAPSVALSTSSGQPPSAAPVKREPIAQRPKPVPRSAPPSSPPVTMPREKSLKDQFGGRK
jgi:serine/threonine-protein kinase